MNQSTLMRDDRGATAIETAFALPVLIAMMWAILQLGLLFRATSGIQHALGEGARAATVWTGEEIVPADIKAKIDAAVYGIGPGTFTVPLPSRGTDCDNQCLDVTVHYSQATNLLIFPGPTVSVTRSKRVWLAD